MESSAEEHEQILQELRIMKQNIVTLRGTIRQITSDSTELVGKYKLIDRQLSIVHKPFVDAVKKALAPVAQAAHTLVGVAETTIAMTEEKVSDIKKSQTPSKRTKINEKKSEEENEVSETAERAGAEGDGTSVGRVKLRRSRRLSSTAPDWNLEDSDPDDDGDGKLSSHKRLKRGSHGASEPSAPEDSHNDPVNIPSTTRKLALGSARRILTTAKKPLSAMSRVYTSGKKLSEHKSARNLR